MHWQPSPYYNLRFWQLWKYFAYLEAVLPLHLALRGVRTNPLAHAGQQVADSLRGGEDIERWRQGALVVKVA